MKIKRAIICTILLNIFFINFLYTNNEYIIGTRSVGFASNFLGVLNHLNWCDKNNKKPLVYWDEMCLYYSKNGYRGSNNCWHYYFDSLLPNERYLKKLKGIATRNYYAPDHSYIPWAADYENKFHKIFDKNYRLKMNTLIEKYIVIKPEILLIALNFYIENMQKKTIGVQIRGTDKNKERVPVPLDDYVKVLNEYKDYQYFIATDEEKIVDYMKEKLNGPVVFFPSHRSKDEHPIHYPPKNTIESALLGEEVLIEVILLSFCDLFVHSVSNVATAVLFFNPELESIFIET